MVSTRNSKRSAQSGLERLTQGGQREGARLIPAKWVAEATSEQISNPQAPRFSPP
jgi:hypothetical protein